MTGQTAYHSTELLTKLAAGNQQALRQVFDVYMQPLCFFGQQLIQNREEAQDIAIHIFTRLWETKPSFPSEAALRSFLYVSMRNRCLNYIRNQKVAQLHQQSLPAETTEEAFVNATMVKAELMQKIYQEIETLPTRQRDILILNIVGELSVKEIAAKLNISESHVRADRSRAIAYVRKALETKGLLEAVILLQYLHI